MFCYCLLETFFLLFNVLHLLYCLLLLYCLECEQGAVHEQRCNLFYITINPDVLFPKFNRTYIQLYINFLTHNVNSTQLSIIIKIATQTLRTAAKCFVKCLHQNFIVNRWLLWRLWVISSGNRNWPRRWTLSWWSCWCFYTRTRLSFVRNIKWDCHNFYSLQIIVNFSIFIVLFFSSFISWNYFFSYQFFSLLTVMRIISLRFIFAPKKILWNKIFFLWLHKTKKRRHFWLFGKQRTN